MADSNRSLRFNRSLKEAGWGDYPIHDPDSGYSSGDKLVAWTLGIGFLVVFIVNLIHWGVK